MNPETLFFIVTMTEITMVILLWNDVPFRKFSDISAYRMGFRHEFVYAST